MGIGTVAGSCPLGSANLCEQRRGLKGSGWSVYYPLSLRCPRPPTSYSGAGVPEGRAAGQTQDLGWGGPTRTTPGWVGVPSPLQASGSVGNDEAAPVAVGRHGSVEGVLRDQGSAGKKGMQVREGSRAGAQAFSPSACPSPWSGAQLGRPNHNPVFACQLRAIVGINVISEELN